MKLEIKSRFTGSVLFSLETDSLKLAVEAAVKSGADLGGANLRDANLRDANLGCANLRGADLRDANLGGADLRDANLRDANLGGADLRDANLRGANLRGADLGGANLGGADLRGANLGGAKQRVVQISTIRNQIVAIGKDVSIGCENHTLAYWLEHYQEIGEANEYSAAEIKLYGKLLKALE